VGHREISCVCVCVNVDNHIVDRCPLRKYGGGLQSLCDVEDDD